ncbi:MAG: nuclear transport factor 2 family protein [Candidatus Eisenbacteria bacterium]|nr:nuclear transport factor 2 family protein [Candidatus Eisenbacteria bacterium]
MNERERQAWEAVRAANRCWTGGEPAKLKEHFHERMVLITPSRNERIVGREACVADWTSFTEKARILSWKETDEDVRLFGDAAVVTYLYEIVVEIEGERYDLKGRDMMTLVFEDDRWWIAADQFSPLHETPGAD